MDRRHFLKTGVTGFAGSYTYWAVGGLSLTHWRSAMAAPVSVSFSAVALSRAVSANKNVLSWQFVDLSQPGPGALGASLVVQQGDEIDITIENMITTHAVKLKIPGIDNSNWQAVPPGGVGSFQFMVSKAGSYIIYDDENGLLGRAMGLAVPLVVLPADGGTGLYNAAPVEHRFQREYMVMLNELDSRINDAVEAGLPVNMETYQPDYFFVNGLSYPDTVYDANGAIDDSKVIYMQAGEQVAIRFINGGLLYYPMHFHGYHTQVVLRDRVLEKNVVEKDTVLLKPEETVDTILNVGQQTGLFPLHTHYVPGVTNAGRYAGGALLMLKAV